jgi:acetyl-CoA carboxylase biotin carboxyl carrier protein
MSLSQEEVIQILKFMSESDFSELHLETGDLKIVVDKRGDSAPIAKREFASVGDAGSLSAPETDIEAPLPSLTETATPESRQVTEEEIAAQGFIPIKSPMLGTFYRAPKPGAPPFVEVGTVVSEETAVCIMEVMKLFSNVIAGTCGRITRICAEDGQLVEHGNVLFLVDPNTD